jgi:hypothetical protein
MSDRPCPEGYDGLADQLARSILSDGPASASALARRVHARKASVLQVLNDARRFDCSGAGRASTWQVRGTGQEPLSATASPPGEYQAILAILDHLEALERRLGLVEQLLGAPTT